MSRWEPGGRDRLVAAAIELFGEQSYPSTTVAQITERAGLNKRTFFRHFADKREILFAGQEALRRSLADAVSGAPPDASPLQAVEAGLPAFAADLSEHRRQFNARRRAIIAANPELQERDLLKRAALTEAIAVALRRRGVQEPTATLAANLGVHAFNAAYSRWLDPTNHTAFPELAGNALRELASVNAALR